MNQWLVFALIIWVSTGTMITVVQTAKVLKGRSR